MTYKEIKSGDYIIKIGFDETPKKVTKAFVTNINGYESMAFDLENGDRIVSAQVSKHIVGQTGEVPAWSHKPNYMGSIPIPATSYSRPMKITPRDVVEVFVVIIVMAIIVWVVTCIIILDLFGQ